MARQPTRFATTYSKRTGDADKLLAEGVKADLGPRWNALVDASVKLTATPSAFGTAEIGNLREQGVDDFAIADLVQAAAFFNWANRLMLSIGESTPATNCPERRLPQAAAFTCAMKSFTNRVCSAAGAP